MKIKILCSLLIVPILSSCYIVSHRKNYFVTGTFIGTEKNDENLICRLDVISIDKNTYIEANGINVVEDLVKGGFYKLECFFIFH